jgi:hypothetical protein
MDGGTVISAAAYLVGRLVAVQAVVRAFYKVYGTVAMKEDG